ncbi:MAG: class IV adenylate cyclase [Phycisphaerales bacterium]|nr:class IV adenylate cyclase [Phycisphaerales bacterium]
MKNLEWKAELRDPNLARLICKKIGATQVAKIRQTDTYYNVARGRLKKREAVAVERSIGSPEPIEYIFYERPDQVAPKVSDYTIYTHDEVLTRFGQAPLPEWLTVTKVRELYLWNSIRIHIDDVHDLGWHFEFEILMNSEKDIESAPERAEKLKSTFLPALGEPIGMSYADLLEQHIAIQAKS